MAVRIDKQPPQPQTRNPPSSLSQPPHQLKAFVGAWSNHSDSLPHVKRFAIPSEYLPTYVAIRRRKKTTRRWFVVGGELYIVSRCALPQARYSSRLASAESMTCWSSRYRPAAPTWCFPEANSTINRRLTGVFNLVMSDISLRMLSTSLFWSGRLRL